MADIETTLKPLSDAQERLRKASGAVRDEVVEGKKKFKARDLQELLNAASVMVDASKTFIAAALAAHPAPEEPKKPRSHHAKKQAPAEVPAEAPAEQPAAAPEPEAKPAPKARPSRA
ncbi:MAG: hypothetical protein HUK26_03135, partial [Duodenibacillus sp.]|nr:hypothetical protein [Duodenibacillus sp.]